MHVKGRVERVSTGIIPQALSTLPFPETGSLPGLQFTKTRRDGQREP